jgi:hypothetical protein
MPGAGAHKFYFVDKVPPIFLIVLALLFANTFLMLALDFISTHLFPSRATNLVSWYDAHSLAIQFILLAALFLILLIFRKRVRHNSWKQH